MHTIFLTVQFDSEVNEYQPEEGKLLPQAGKKKCRDHYKISFDRNIQATRTELQNCLTVKPEKYGEKLTATANKIVSLEEEIEGFNKSLCPTVSSKKEKKCLTEVKYKM